MDQQPMSVIEISGVIDLRDHPLCQQRLDNGEICNKPCEAIGPNKDKPFVKQYNPFIAGLEISTISWPSEYSHKCYYHNAIEASERHQFEAKIKRRLSHE